MDQKDILEKYRKDPKVSVLIIGAGVNGIGVFRDLAFQDIDVLLVDRGDFCSGASAASSHMIHGGIRYLENGEFGLVKEAVQERNLLLQNAPHYVKPLSTVIPIYKRFSGLFNAPLKFLGLMDKPSERGAAVIKIGLSLYDAYSGKQSQVPKHQFNSRKNSFRAFPKINPKVIYTGQYFDAAMSSPERICIEMVLDAENANQHAHGLNYVSIQDAYGNTVLLEDQLSDQVISIEPQIVINAAGPWIDLVNSRLGVQTRFIAGTKGSHLILANPELREAIAENEFFFENRDGRIVLIFPLFDKVIVGTTDIPIDDPDQARCTEDEIKYFIDMVDFIFPGIPITREQIIYQFSGVRPLPPSGARRTGQISRDHSIQEITNEQRLKFPILNLVGGKWTSFRRFSEQVTDRTLMILGKDRKIDTRSLQIGGGKDYPDSHAARVQWIDSYANKSSLTRETVALLFERYGTRASQMINYAVGDATSHLIYHPDFHRFEIEFISRKEKVVHLDDFLLRRSHLAKLGELTREGISEITEIIAKELSWSEKQKNDETQRIYDILIRHHGVAI